VPAKAFASHRAWCRAGAVAVEGRRRCAVALPRPAWDLGTAIARV